MKHLKRILWIVVALMMIAVLSASASAESVAPQLAFKQASYETEALNSLWLDEEYTVTGEPGALTWTSSDPSIARVYNNGQVYGKKPGEVTITLTGSKGGKAETKVVVKENAYKTITISPATLTLEAGDFDWLNYTYTLADETKPATQSTYYIIWTSSDESVVEAGSYGTVSAIDEGTATITATIKNLDGTEVVSNEATVKVLPGKKLESLKFVRDSYTVKYPSNKALKVNGSPVDFKLYVGDISYESSDEQIATVEADYSNANICHVYPHKPGTVTITAKYEEDETPVVATTTVTIEAKPVSKVSLDRTKLTLSDNRETYTNAVSFKVEPSGAYYDKKETYWESSDTDIIKAWVNEYDGTVYLGIGDKYGTATITVYVWDGITWHTATCEVTVISQDTGTTLNITKKTLYLYAMDNQSDYKSGFTLTATNDAGDEYDQSKIKWSTSKKDVATVNKSGWVKAVGTGKSTITATGPDGSTAKCKVTVKKNLIKKIKGNKMITMRVGDTEHILPSYDSEYDWEGLISTSPKWDTLYDPSFSFKSSDDSVVSVNAKGLLKANGLGTAKITVKAKDGSKKKFTFKVNVIDPRK